MLTPCHTQVKQSPDTKTAELQCCVSHQPSATETPGNVHFSVNDLGKKRSSEGVKYTTALVKERDIHATSESTGTSDRKLTRDS